MNLDDLTLGQLKQLQTISPPAASNLSRYIGQYVIVRSRNEGVNAGVVEAIDASAVILREARRLWWHKPADQKQSWYEGVANSGLSSDSKVSPVVKEKAIIEDYSITLCSSVARESIEGHPNHVG